MDEYVFVVTYSIFMTSENRSESVHVWSDTERKAFECALEEAYCNIKDGEGLSKVELLYVI